MATLSKLHGKCKECKHKDSCNDKRMVACALAEMPKNNMKEEARSITVPLGQTASRKCTPIKINMGEYGKIGTSLEELQEQFERDLEKELYKGVFRCGA